ncbi:hypothetical protein BAE44_0019982 [Dichanthelium oligosanthes]|uniref:Uncharacterized protein n=1 Tax=Dichanthelium oligosanthes TaxID=888268 RepID=A0A1E5V1H9_9POAL|nr:hypothetical protein BAE44_0019982 [Dichanthelium oligosanthes]
MGDHEGPWPRSVAHIALCGCAGLPSMVDLIHDLHTSLSNA